MSYHDDLDDMFFDGDEILNLDEIITDDDSADDEEPETSIKRPLFGQTYD